MPVKRRYDKRRPHLPDVLQRIVDRQPVEFSSENWQILIAARYFGDWPALSVEHVRRIAELLEAWRDMQRATERAARPSPADGVRA